MSSVLTRRLSATVALGLFACVTAVLLLSDRVGAIYGRTRYFVVETGRSIESRYGIDVLDRSDVPGTWDQIGHAMLWGSGMVLIGWITRKRIPVPITALFVAGISLLFEFSQPLLSATRAAQPTDAVGNLVGVALGTAVLMVALPVIRYFNGDDREYFGDRRFATQTFDDQVTRQGH